MTVKSLLLPVALFVTVGISFSTSAAGNDCNARRQSLEDQTVQAEKYGHKNKVAGLKKALSEVNEHCTDAGLLKDARQKVGKMEEKLAEKQKDIAEISADLRQAEAEHDAEKVAKYQRKLSEKQADIREVTDELHQARSEVSGLEK
ncbi:MAG: Protein YqjC [Candidatus Erwinia impunctatus]|nr:Protein YqjC [Culicoides impunctatus]